MVGSDLNTLQYIKQLNNKDLLYSTGNYTQYSIITYNGKESEKESICMYVCMYNLGFPCGSDGKAGDPGSIPGSGRSLGEGNGKPLQYSCLENPMDRAAWRATVHGVAKSRTRLSDFTSLHV